MPAPITEPLVELAAAWRSATGVSRRRIAIAGVSFAWVISLLVARSGTIATRLVAAAVIGGSAAIAIGWRVLEGKGLHQPARIVKALVHRADPEGAERVLRALSLLGPRAEGRAQGTSEELARLHVTRAIARLPFERIVRGSVRTSARVGAAALVALAGVFSIVVVCAWSVLEGADVLAARHGLAPVNMRWLDDVDVEVRPPEYLREGERRGLAFLPLRLPFGTLVTVRGAPMHRGRSLFLTDGTSDVRFVDDGAGGVVARWSLAASTNLRVSARLGEVTIPGTEALDVESIADLPPAVALEGAPRQVLLVQQGDDDVPIRYEATDDHGLREVHLVLRSGTREERRVLAHLDGETRSDKGGYLLKLRDPFVRKSQVPIDVTVEARDNDPLAGPKWGKSAAIILVPPNVGELEALRLDGLRRMRDALVDLLAWRLSNAPPSEVHAKSAFIAEETARAATIDALVVQAFVQAGGARVPLRVRSTLVAHQEKTRKAVEAEIRRPSSSTHADVVAATERFVLMVDAALRGLGLGDARDSARQLADVADDLAREASRVHADARLNGALHMDSATTVLAAGARELKRLGELGRDLSEIIDADLLRVKRARDGADFVHAELAARDLAARLHEPDPSFGSRGGAVGRAGGDLGGDRGPAGDEEAPGDDVDQAFEEAARGIEQLAQDHAGEIVKMDQALAAATSDEEVEQLRQDAKRHAEAVREAVRGLPSVGSGSDSWTSKGAAARELAEQMARSLERANAKDAVQSGAGAIDALDEAKKMVRKGGWMDDTSGEGRVETARRKIEVEEKWAERELEQMAKRAAERARNQLQQGGEEEGKLADRARDLAREGSDRASLPQQAVESIRDAERAARQAADELRRGDAEKGLYRQREAQRSLEAASEQLHDDEDRASGSSPANPEDGRDGRAPSARGNVPAPGDHKGPEEFRKRVVRGLGQTASGALKDAVRRYAQGLLR